MAKFRVLTLSVAAAALILGSVAPVEAAPPPGETTAWFEGRIIDLKQGWGEATACVIWNSAGTRQCFRTEASLKLWLSLRGQVSTTQSLTAACSTALRLYDGTNYTGSVLFLYDRGIWLNLGALSWSNRASSFKVGACNSILADGTSGGGDWYPTTLSQAGDVAGTMLTGWNNRVSSVYIY